MEALLLEKRKRKQKGFTLLETLLAAAILVIAAAGILGLFGVALMQNSVEGDHGTRTTEYAQDKMEQLMALSLTDTTSDVTQYPTCLAIVTSTCAGHGLTAGGSVNPASPTTGYVDYIDGNGNPMTSATNAVYIREWLIVNDSNSPTQIKTITVMVKKIIESGPIVPSTTLVSQKGSL
jgi:prepilin-type N-terminal cleavage/methylation domain-containing protein